MVKIPVMFQIENFEDGHLEPRFPLITVGVPREGESILIEGHTYEVDFIQWEFVAHSGGRSYIPIVTLR